MYSTDVKYPSGNVPCRKYYAFKDSESGFISSNIILCINVTHERMSHFSGRGGEPRAQDQLGSAAALSDSGGVMLF